MKKKYSSINISSYQLNKSSKLNSKDIVKKSSFKNTETPLFLNKTDKINLRKFLFDKKHPLNEKKTLENKFHRKVNSSNMIKN